MARYVQRRTGRGYYFKRRTPDDLKKDYPKRNGFNVFSLKMVNNCRGSRTRGGL